MTLRSQSHNRIIIGILIWLSTNSAWGLATDRYQPIEIEADYAQLDDATNTTIYKGKVVVIQGTIRLNGDQMVVKYTPEHEIKEALLTGKPARFKQRPDNSDVDSEGEAIQIQYFAKDNMVYLIDEAKVTHFRRIYTGYRMEYDTKRNFISMRKAAEGEKTPSGKKPIQEERVKIIIPSPNKPES
jgi:lipopolysaccharide export system protein LptA